MSEEQSNNRNNSNPSTLSSENGSSVGTTTKALNDSVQYVAPRTIAVTSLVTSIGVSRAFIRGDKVALPFYVFSGTGIVLSGLFFTGAYVMKTARQQDDYLNFAVPSAIQAGAFMAFSKGGKKGLVGGLVGGLAGTVYYYSSNALYNFSRDVYVKYRIRVNTPTSPGILISNRPKFNGQPEMVIDLGKIFSFGSSNSNENKTESTNNTTGTNKSEGGNEK